jgi:hypothetical protein
MLRERRPLIHHRVPPKAGSCEPPAPSAETLATGFFLLQCMRNGGQRFRRDFNMIFRSAPGCAGYSEAISCGGFYVCRLWATVPAGGRGGFPHRGRKMLRINRFCRADFTVSELPRERSSGILYIRVSRRPKKGDDNRARKSTGTAATWSPDGVQTQISGLWRPTGVQT